MKNFFLLILFPLLFINDSSGQNPPSVNEWFWVWTWGYNIDNRTRSFWGEEGQIFEGYAGTMVSPSSPPVYRNQTDWTKNLDSVYPIPDSIFLTFKVRNLKNVIKGEITYAVQKVPEGRYVREEFLSFNIVPNVEQTIKFLVFSPKWWGMEDFNVIYLVWRLYSPDSTENGMAIEMLSFQGKYDTLGLGIVELESFTPPSEVKDEDITISDYSLDQNYPNPFNPSTQINFALPYSSYVTLKVYDLIGQEVATLVSGYMEAGSHYVNFNASGLTSGIYFYSINAGKFTSTKKMIFMK